MTRVLLATLLAAALAEPVLAQELDPKVVREEAQRSIMIRWSWNAKTKNLGLSPTTNDFINLWLDFCRNKWQRRARRSRTLHGTPHCEWRRNKESLTFVVSFTSIEIARAELPLKDAPRLLRACVDQNFVPAVWVDDDDNKLLLTWGVVLATKLAEATEAALLLGASRPHPQLWTGAKVKALDVLIEGFDDTQPATEGYVRGPMLGAQRKIWLDAIRVIAAERSGEFLKPLYENMIQEKNSYDIDNAAAALAGAQGKAAAEFALKELASGDLQRLSRVILAVGSNVSPKVLEMIHALLKASDNRSLVLSGSAALERAAQPGGKTAKTARNLLFDLAKGIPNEKDYKVVVVRQLLPVAKEDPAIVHFLKEYVVVLKNGLSELNPYQRQHQQKVIAEMEETIRAAEGS
ncbi:MAG: hypothetical protein ACYTGV_01985 [Planctomycetota bacterium]|jgi:hypothetical protein